jgi:hypothetical protein
MREELHRPQLYEEAYQVHPQAEGGGREDWLASAITAKEKEEQCFQFE